MMNFRSRLNRLAFCLATFLLLPASAFANVELRFGVNLSGMSQGMIKNIKPMVSQLEDQLSQLTRQSVQIRPVIIESYETAVADLNTGRIDFLRVDAASYFIAKARSPKLSILVLESEHENPNSVSVICVKEGGNVQDISRLSGKSFAFGEKNSAAGHYIPQQHLMGVGLKARDLADYRFVDRQRNVGIGVAAGVFDAGVIEKSIFDQLVKEGRPIRSIGKIENVATMWISGPHLPPDLGKKLIRAFKALQFDELKFVEGKDSDFVSIRSAIENNGQFYN